MKNLLPALALATIASPALADDKFSLTTGFDYTTGKYGNASSTDILYVPVTGQYQSGDMTLRLTVPYISVTGPGGVIRGFGRISPAPTATGGGFGRSGTGGATTATNSGLGDIVASAGYTVYSGDQLSVDGVGKVKFGTADANKGLGTGKNDYFAELDGYYSITGQSTLMLTGGYAVIGAPAGITTNNVLYGMAGFDQKTSDITNVGVMYHIMQSPAPAFGIAGQRDVTLYGTRKLSPTLKVQVYALKGFTDSSPDYGGGVMVTGAF